MKINRRLAGLLLACVVLITIGFSTPSAQAAQVGAGRFEHTIGSGAASDIVNKYGGEYILPIQQRMWVEEIFSRLVAVTEREEVEYTLTVLDSSEVNAFALPGGYVFITRGLLNLVDGDEAKLAAVLGHEIAHVEKKHGVNAVLRQMGLTVLAEVGVMVIDFISADLLRVASVTLVEMMQRGWGREAEYEADALGQVLAVQAGFDPIGAVAMLDDFLKIDEGDLPMKIFRTHPDTINRRERVVDDLISFWPEPVLVTDHDILERLNERRNCDQTGRSDPKRRYSVTVVDDGEKSGLTVFDQQLGNYVSWADDVIVHDFVWSPHGQHLAVITGDQFSRQLQIYDRHGFVVRKVDLTSTQREIAAISWSPQGGMLALDLLTSEGGAVVVTYLGTEAYLEVDGGLSASGSIWLDDGLYFVKDDQWYCTKEPTVEPVTLPRPVPQVLERRRILSPTIIKEGNTIRLTRPSLDLP